MRGLGKKFLVASVWIALVALAATNGLLVRQNLQMRTELDKYKPNTLKEGGKVESFDAKELQGNFYNVSYTGKEIKRVLLYFTPDCQYCREQFVYWKEMLKHVDTEHFQILGIVSEAENKNKLKEYLRAIDCDSMLVIIMPDKVRRSYKLSLTPTTMVIASDGTVEKVWAGKWSSKVAEEAGSFFGCHFSQNQGKIN